jgi:membrane-associated protein
MTDSVLQSLLNNVALLEFLSPENILAWLGPWALIGVTFIIFAECGLLIGFFLPGDSLIFVTGLFVAQGFINEPIWLVASLLAVAAVSGNLVGYWIGKAIGPKLFEKPDSRIFKREYVDKTHDFFEKYGARAIILARFVPVVRTFITATAGIVGMDFRRFATYSAIGGLIWGAGISLLGYFLGGFPIVKENVEIVLLLVVVVSIVPIAYEYIKHRRKSLGEALDDIAEEGL